MSTETVKIDAKLVKELREKSGAPMGDCLKALQETAGDMENAFVALRKRGLAGLRKGVVRRFDFTLRFATPDIRLASAHAFAVVGGGCTGRAVGARPNRAVVVKTALTCEFLISK